MADIMQDNVQFFKNSQQAESVEPNLPPAGYKRNEELARRADNLAQAAEERYGDDIGAIDPRAFEVDREIRYDLEREFHYLDLGPEFVLKWVNWKSGSGVAVWKAKADGWKTVTPDLVKSDLDWSMVREDNTLRIGDTLAMYIRIDRHKMLMMRDRKKALIAQFGPEEGIRQLEREINAKSHSRGQAVQFLDEGDPRTSDAFSKIKKKSARNMASRALKQKLEAGTVPGMEMGR